jgi:hypothetical protein
MGQFATKVVMDLVETEIRLEFFGDVIEESVVVVFLNFFFCTVSYCQKLGMMAYVRLS